MKAPKLILIFLIVLFSSISLSGCWNYREVDDMSVVTGVAIDKKDDRYLLTVELVDVAGKATPGSRIISMTGETMFDAARNAISLSGKKLYWAHSKMVIVSEEVAREGMEKIVDWFNRDSETRADVHIVISKEKTAKEILEKGGAEGKEIMSFKIDDILRNEKTLSKAPITEIADYVNDMEAKGVSTTLPVVVLAKGDSKVTPQITGTGVFRLGKLTGFLDGEETKFLLLIRDKLKGGVLVQKETDQGQTTKIALEIFDSKTKIKPTLKNDNIEMMININMEVAIDEIQGTQNYIDDKGRKKLEKTVEDRINRQTENLIKKVQSQYSSDIFGFGTKIKEDMPDVWKKLEPKWNGKKFKDMKAKVKTTIKIRNSAMLAEPLKVGD